MVFSVFIQTTSARADPLSVQIQPSAISTPINTQVQLFANVSGGLPDYQYRWYANSVSLNDNFTSATCTFNATEMGTFVIGCQVRDSVNQYADAPEITIIVTEPQLVGQAPPQATTAPAETSPILQNIALISAILVVVVVIVAVAIIAIKKRKLKQPNSKEESK